MENSLLDLIKYLSVDGRPVTMQEFKPFWESCSEAEKNEFKTCELTPLTLTK